MKPLTTNTRIDGSIFLLLYLLSGTTSLAYEVLWTRMLSLQFGVSIFGVVATVTAFMAGLGLGSLVGTRWSLRLAQPLRLFAALEIGVALFALVTPALLQALDNGLGAVTGGADVRLWFGLQLAAVILVLMLPAFAMGAGFPMILAVISETRVSLAAIYGVNAMGGAIGAVLPLWLLPTLGWLSAVQMIAVLGMLVGGVALWLSYRIVANSTRHGAPLQRPPLSWLAAYAGIGAGALMLEIGWTRLFGMVLLRTEYVLAVILAVFLVGIGLGSLLARHMQRQGWFVILPIIACGFALLSLWLLPSMSQWVEGQQFASLASALLQQGCVIATLTLPVTLVLGAWLPLLTKRLGDHYHSGAWLYGANSLGAALGALLAGFLFIPLIGSSATIVAGSLLLLLLGLGWGRSPRAWLAVPVMVLCAWPVLDMPAVSSLMPHTYTQATSLYTHEDAISITHVVTRPDGQRQLLADLRRMDASSDPTAVAVQMNQARLPLLLHPAPRTVLFLGLGTGISAAGSLPFPGLERTAVELSQGAIVAARDYFSAVNGGITGQLRIVRDDARHFLMSDSGHYDVIIGDLFHPDLVGRSALLSRQQFRRAQLRLAEGGIFVQWLALNQFDPDNLAVVLRSFREVFPEAVIFVDAFRLALVGPKEAEISAPVMLANLQRMTVTDAEQASGGEGPWTWLGRYWGRIPADSGPMQDEWAPVIEFQLPGARYRGDLDLSRLLAQLLAQRPKLADAAQQLAVPEAESETFERAYAATDLAHRSWVALLRQQTGESQRLLPLAYQANPRDRWIGFAMADAILADSDTARARGLDQIQLYEMVLRVRPDHTEALSGLWRLLASRGETARAEEFRARLAALSPLDSSLHAGVGHGIIPLGQ